MGDGRYFCMGGGVGKVGKARLGGSDAGKLFLFWEADILSYDGNVASLLKDVPTRP